MVKAVLFDANGVVIGMTKLFSECLSAEHGVPIDQIKAFFRDAFQPCLIGQADLREVIKPYLQEWFWDKGVDSLLDFWFMVENHTDPEIVGYVRKLREAGIKCYIVTNQEKYRGNYMRKQMRFDEIFDGMFISGEMGVKKPVYDFWQIVWEKLDSLGKEEILLFDDEIDNVTSGREFGYLAELVDLKENRPRFHDILAKLLEHPVTV